MYIKLYIWFVVKFSLDSGAFSSDAIATPPTDKNNYGLRIIIL